MLLATSGFTVSLSVASWFPRVAKYGIVLKAKQSQLVYQSAAAFKKPTGVPKWSYKEREAQTQKIDHNFQEVGQVVLLLGEST